MGSQVACSVCGLRHGVCLTCPRQAQAARVLGWRLRIVQILPVAPLLVDGFSAFALSGRASLVDSGCLLACSDTGAALYLQRPVSCAYSKHSAHFQVSRLWQFFRSLSSCTVHVIFWSVKSKAAPWSMIDFNRSHPPSLNSGHWERADLTCGSLR